MFQIRNSIFETNSSSTHSMTMCSGEEYNAWKRGETLFDAGNNRFISREECIAHIAKDPDSGYKPGFENYVDDRKLQRILDDYDEDADLMTYDGFWARNDMEYTFDDSYTTKSGETVVAFGYYGYDG